MNKILVRFFGTFLTLFGALTAIGLIGIPFLILGIDLIKYSNKI